MEVLVGTDRDRSAAAMRDHVITSMQRALERLEPYFRARKAQGRRTRASSSPLSFPRYPRSRARLEGRGPKSDETEPRPSGSGQLS